MFTWKNGKSKWSAEAILCKIQKLAQAQWKGKYEAAAPKKTIDQDQNHRPPKKKAVAKHDQVDGDTS
jgi:hypothetical protein